MPTLTRVEAADRAGLLTVRGYAVDLDLTRGPTGFASTTAVRFGCTRPGADTFVELRPSTLHEATLNGRVLDPASLDGNRLPLTGLAADNELVVRATMAYSNNGEGLHRFVDPADGETYLYAHTFLDNAQRVFACFDQPDLKTAVTLTVTAPDGWTVLANGAGRCDDHGRWTFAETPPISTYLVSLAAGPYHSHRAEHDGIPLGIHCRLALAPHLERDAPEILGVTTACFDRYHELFGVRYPFGKYDQVFVPEFNPGAMENPGCVTFRDEMVFRSAVTDAQRAGRATVIAHEMAHMWFGDLVTMRWWDDLWLNESFADYLGVRVTREVTRFTGTWVEFAIDDKVNAYAADQRPSTHPVAPDDVPHTDAALLNFDGISYAKGASVLRQLAGLLGDEAFFAGLRRYFADHAYGNATFADLLAALGAAAGRDLTPWARVWLRDSGVTTLRPVAAVGPDQRYTGVTIAQTATPPHPALRPHRLAIGLYDRDGDGAVVRRERVEVEIDPDADHGQTPVPALAGRPAAALLLVNDDDMTYAKTRLSDAEVAALPALLPAVADPLARALTWSAVWDATRDGELAPAAFLALVVAALPAEPDVSVYTTVIRLAAVTTVGQFLAPGDRPDAMAALAAACADTLAAAAAGGPRQLAAARAYVGCAGPADVATLRAWLTADTDGAPPGLPIDAELRWLVLRRLVVLGAAGSADIDAERRRDRSASGEEHAATCRGAVPRAGAKAAAWRSMMSDPSLSNRQVIALARGFWQPEQDALTDGYVARYFAELPAAAADRTPEVVRQLAAAAYPRYAISASTVAAADRLLARDDLPDAVRRVVVDQTDDVRRALAVRAAARA